MFPVTFDDLIHGSLFLVQFFHNRAQGVVHGVELLELLIQVIGFIFHLLDFLFSRAYLSFQLFYFVVQDEFELFKFLRSLFEFINLLFFVANDLIGFFDFGLFILNFLLISKILFPIDCSTYLDFRVPCHNSFFSPQSQNALIFNSRFFC